MSDLPAGTDQPNLGQPNSTPLPTAKTEPPPAVVEPSVAPKPPRPEEIKAEKKRAEEMIDKLEKSSAAEGFGRTRQQPVGKKVLGAVTGKAGKVVLGLVGLLVVGGGLWVASGLVQIPLIGELRRSARLGGGSGQPAERIVPRTGGGFESKPAGGSQPGGRQDGPGLGSAGKMSPTRGQQVQRGGDEGSPPAPAPPAPPPPRTTTTKPQSPTQPGWTQTSGCRGSNCDPNSERSVNWTVIHVCGGYSGGSPCNVPDADAIVVPNIPDPNNPNWWIDYLQANAPDKYQQLLQQGGTVQVDYFDGGFGTWEYQPQQQVQVTGGDEGGGDEGGPPPPSGPTPTPVPGLFCAGLASSIPTPSVGDSLTLTCSAPTSKPVDHFEFRYQVDGGSFVTLAVGTAQTSGGQYIGTSQMTVDQAGDYSVQCRVCEDAASTKCTTWGMDQ